jgi:glyoxylase-like metal-dependent hydrolase (beta-lactamase superfamily II)
MPDGRIRVGNVEVIGLTDASLEFPLPLSALFPTIPGPAWEPFRDRYPDIFPTPDSAHFHFGCYLIRSEGQTILVDTGIGNATTNPGMQGMIQVDGRLPAELLSASVRPDDIDTVFFTHLHIDHVGWNLSQRGPNARATFPRARHVMHRADWDFFQQPAQQEMAKYWDETLGPLEGLGLVDLLDDEKALTSEVTAVPCPGHTPGHMVLHIASQGEHAIVIGDAAIHPAQVTELDWGVIFETDQPMAATSRHLLFSRAEHDDATLVACHFPGKGFGKLVRVEGRRYWQSLDI